MADNAKPADTKKAATPREAVKPKAAIKTVAAPVVAKPAAKPADAPRPVAAKPATAPPSALIEAAIEPVIQSKETPVNDTIKATAEQTQAQAKAMFADVNNRAKGAVEKSSKMFEDMNDMSKGNIEALVESSKIAAKGIETLSRDAADYTRKSLESATAAMKTFAGVKSPTEFMKLHSDYVRSSFDAMIAQASHSTEAMLKLAGEVGQPISNRMAVAAEKVKIAA